MKEYKYAEYHMFTFFSFGDHPDHRKIINDHAARGWRYVGFLPTDSTSHGKITAVDLIFERDVPDTPQ